MEDGWMDGWMMVGGWKDYWRVNKGSESLAQKKKIFIRNLHAHANSHPRAALVFPFVGGDIYS